ncbi:MAG TPA: hypothetical protein VF712_12555 [Thermoleophilaceae bacterium]
MPALELVPVQGGKRLERIVGKFSPEHNSRASLSIIYYELPPAAVVCGLQVGEKTLGRLINVGPQRSKKPANNRHEHVDNERELAERLPYIVGFDLRLNAE